VVAVSLKKIDPLSPCPSVPPEGSGAPTPTPKPTKTPKP